MFTIVGNCTHNVYYTWIFWIVCCYILHTFFHLFLSFIYSYDLIIKYKIHEIPLLISSSQLPQNMSSSFFQKNQSLLPLHNSCCTGLYSTASASISQNLAVGNFHIRLVFGFVVEDQDFNSLIFTNFS